MMKPICLISILPPSLSVQREDKTLRNPVIGGSAGDQVGLMILDWSRLIIIY